MCIKYLIWYRDHLLSSLHFDNLITGPVIPTRKREHGAVGDQQLPIYLVLANVLVFCIQHISRPENHSRTMDYNPFITIYFNSIFIQLQESQDVLYEFRVSS
jgi:hypothetical protein